MVKWWLHKYIHTFHARSWLLHGKRIESDREREKVWRRARGREKGERKEKKSGDWRIIEINTNQHGLDLVRWSVDFKLDFRLKLHISGILFSPNFLLEVKIIQYLYQQKKTTQPFIDRSLPNTIITFSRFVIPPLCQTEIYLNDKRLKSPHKTTFVYICIY